MRFLPVMKRDARTSCAHIAVARYWATRRSLNLLQFPSRRMTHSGQTDVFQLSGLLAGDVKESRNGNPTRDLQMAADRTRPHTLCGPMVSSLFALAARCRGTAEGARSRCRSHNGWRWVQYYGPELEQRLRRHLKPTNKSWRVDETYVRVKGRWCYLYRAIDSKGATIDFLLSAFRDADAAKRLFRKALGDRSHRQPRVINTDLAPIYSSAIPDSKKEGALRNCCRHGPVQYLNNILEQDHRAIKRRVNAKEGFREFRAARRTIQGYEAVHRIRKGQVRWVAGDDLLR
jgi:transposase, IS6 family